LKEKGKKLMKMGSLVAHLSIKVLEGDFSKKWGEGWH
jgi:hypothetical protein